MSSEGFDTDCEWCQYLETATLNPKYQAVFDALMDQKGYA